MIIARFKVRCHPDKADTVAAVLQDVVAPSRATEGVISFDIGRDVAEPHAFIATEIFEDRAALDRQESLPEVAKAMSAFETALAAPPGRRSITSPAPSRTGSDPARRRPRPW
jgi:quinol monooxygenase YgiN